MPRPLHTNAQFHGRTYQQFVDFLHEPGESEPMLSPGKYAVALRIWDRRFRGGELPRVQLK